MGRGGYRPNSGPAKGTKYKTKSKLAEVNQKPGNNLEAKSTKGKTDDSPGGKIGHLDNFTPLEYMQKVMNDPGNDTSTRLRAASLAAPFIHSRKGEGTGKKGERDEKAKTAGAGRFASSPPPLRVIK